MSSHNAENPTEEAKVIGRFGSIGSPDATDRSSDVARRGHAVLARVGLRFDSGRRRSRRA